VRGLIGDIRDRYCKFPSNYSTFEETSQTLISTQNPPPPLCFSDNYPSPAAAAAAAAVAIPEEILQLTLLAPWITRHQWFDPGIAEDEIHDEIGCSSNATLTNTTEVRLAVQTISRFRSTGSYLQTCEATLPQILWCRFENQFGIRKPRTRRPPYSMFLAKIPINRITDIRRFDGDLMLRLWVDLLVLSVLGHGYAWQGGWLLMAVC
ncbi:hypothetical protein AKJ16_DCAP18343, partial [Drosera capensis]